MGNLVKKSTVKLYVNGVMSGVIFCDDIEISEESLLFGGERVSLYDVLCFLDGNLVFASSACGDAQLCYSDENHVYKLYIDKIA